MNTKPSILIIYTGGTIGMQRDESGTLIPFDFNSIEKEFPAVRPLNVHIDVHKMPPIDSSNVTQSYGESLLIQCVTTTTNITVL